MEDPQTLESTATDFRAVKLGLASPDQILKWSYGEVTKPETINYRTQKPEKDGLFDERIFGPTKDWECYCGKYKRIRYKDVVCDKCGVQVTRSIVRRERMGHIRLAVPVTHIWFLRGTPSMIGLALGISVRDLERIVYFASYIVTDVNEESRQRALSAVETDYKTRRDELTKKHQAATDGGEITAEQIDSELQELELARSTAKSDLTSLAKLQSLSEARYRDLNLKFGDVFKASIGAEAIRNLLADIDFDKITTDLRAETQATAGAKRKKALKRLKLFEGMRAAGIRPEWMVPTVVPVIPPDLRPMVQLDGGRFAASDLNDLYRRVINRNNRLRRLMDLDAPEVICRNEKRMLQEAVDALIDNNARRERAVSSTGTRRKLKSLADMLKGKQGRFRQNLLGKRVDYSGRSVIVVGPSLKLYQCGLPKMMALELFKPFVVGRLITEGYAHNVKSAARMIERARNEVWDVLEDIIKDKYVLLNRAPTLHRLGIQAFQPILIEGKAIQIHPSVCPAFNADFDGDQMAVHVPLSSAAQREAREIMLSTKNLLKPSAGDPIVNPQQDMVLGCYYLTQIQDKAQGEGKRFSGQDEAIYAYQSGKVDVRAKVKVKIPDGVVETTIGRILFNNILPADFGFRNDTMTKSLLKKIVAEVYTRYGVDQTADLIDQIKDLGFRFATSSGLSFGIDDLVVPDEKPVIVDEAEKKAIDVARQYNQGLITEDERYQRIIAIWKEAKEDIRSTLEAKLSNTTSTVATFVDSGARGDLDQANQMSGMIGLMVNPTGKIIELPIRSNYKDGLSVLEYFISTHGARKGLTDTALRTAQSGYLTRRLVDVSQDVIVTEEDCGDTVGTAISREAATVSGEPLKTWIAGRIAAATVIDPVTKETIVKNKQMIDDEAASHIETSTVAEVKVRSVLRCRTRWGVCQTCYGIDLAHGQPVKLGEAVGVIAAQSIGEPGTQLTMKTFHSGGVAGEDITHGLPRIEEIFEARAPKGQAILAENSGVIELKKQNDKTIIKIIPSNQKVTEYELEGVKPTLKTGAQVQKGDVLAADDKGKHAIKAAADGTVKVTKTKITLVHGGGSDKDYTIPSHINVEVREGDLVTIGQRLTEGSVNLQDMFALMGEAAVEHYIVTEVQRIYSGQGQSINPKHIEVIISQMFSRVRIEDPGDTAFVVGDIVSKVLLEDENQEAEDLKGKPATYEKLILSISKVSTSSDSFLAAASFQETTRVLISAAIRGKVDHLRGLKENVIIGRLIPVGTGFREETVD